jgi:hypothetical protein
MNTLVEAWRDNMAGLTPNVEAFLTAALDHVRAGERVAGRLIGPEDVTLRVGATEVSVHTDRAAGYFRMACARLAVIFAGTNVSPPVYGGTLSCVLPGTDGVKATLRLSNTTALACFEIERSQ